MRTNTLRVLRQLSTIGLKRDEHKIMQLTSIRTPLMKVNHQTTIASEEHAREGSSNLFFYLFEDYSAAIGILHQSKSLLDKLVG